MKVSVEYITPEQAEIMLQNNPNNRKLEKRRVEKMAEQMRRGAWRNNGSSIVMNGSSLLDGQHRLHAILESGLTVPFIVVRDVERSAFGTIDTGRPRSFSDYLTIRGVAHPTTVAAAVRMHVVLGKGLAASAANRLDLTFEEMDEHLFKHPEIAVSVEFISGMANRAPMNASSMAAVHAIARMKGGLLADDYFRSIIEGTGLTAGSVAHHVWSRLNSRSKGMQSTLAPWQKVALLIHGWNLIRSGRTVSHIKVGGRMGKTGKVRDFPAIA